MRAFAAMTFAFLAGCGVFWEDPFFPVEVSPLNWVEIHYYNASKQPIRRTSVRLTGSGTVEVRTGDARRISDDFAKDLAGSDAAYSERRFEVDAEHVRDVFQRLVNAGLFDRDRCFKTADEEDLVEGRFIAVRAAIDNKTYSEHDNLFQTDPDLGEIAHNVVLEFRRPSAGRRARRPAAKDARAKDAKAKDGAGRNLRPRATEDFRP